MEVTLCKHHLASHLESDVYSTTDVDNVMVVELTRCRVAHGDRRDGRCAWCGAVRPKGRRRWCSDACSYAWRDNHYWPYARAAALDRDHGVCTTCGDPEDPEVHHLVPVRERGGYGAGCQHHQDNLVTLCHAHHVEADAARRRAAKGEATQLSLLAA